MLGSQKYDLKEGAGKLILAPRKQFGFQMFIFFVNLFVLISVALRNKTALTWMLLAVLSALAVFSAIMIYLQYRESKKRLYPIFEFNEKGISEIGEAERREIEWSDIKHCTLDFVENGLRTVTVYDILIFSSDDDTETTDKIKNIIYEGGNVRAELSKVENTVCIVLESSENDIILDKISDYLAKKDVKIERSK